MAKKDKNNDNEEEQNKNDSSNSGSDKGKDKNKKKDENSSEDNQKPNQEDLESKFKVTPDKADKKDDKKPILFKPKKDWSLDAYKKVRSVEVEYKAESWLPMGDAFQKLTLFPGFPQGHIHQVYGRSDMGKTTMLLELAKGAQSVGVLPIFVITEKKWSWDRAEMMGIDRNFCLFRDDLTFIEEAGDYVNSILNDQASGNLPHDIIFLWDSVGATPSRAEWEAAEEREHLIKKAIEAGEEIKDIKTSSGGMMISARVLKDQITRKIQHKITATRNVNFPYFASMFVVNHGYISPNPMGPASLVAFGGEGLTYACSFIFRQGKVSGKPKRMTATKNGVDTTWGLKVPLILEKNHINGISREGEVIVTPHGYIEASKESEDAYKKKYSNDWKAKFDDYFETDDGEVEPEGE